MLIVLLVISILIIVAGFDLDDLGMGLACFGMIASIVVIMLIIGSVIAIVDLKTVDSKIAMYEEENAKIEQDVATIVKDYMNYEKDTYKLTAEELEASSLLILTELYPDLKSNELVKKQIDIYIENNNKIKQLKEQKINNQACKWWLYFGSVEENKQ